MTEIQRQKKGHKRQRRDRKDRKETNKTKKRQKTNKRHRRQNKRHRDDLLEMHHQITAVAPLPKLHQEDPSCVPVCLAHTKHDFSRGRSEN